MAGTDHTHSTVTGARLHGRGPLIHGSSAIWPESSHTRQLGYMAPPTPRCHAMNANARTGTPRDGAQPFVLSRSLARNLRNLANVRERAVQRSSPAFAHRQRAAFAFDLFGRRGRLRRGTLPTLASLQKRGGVERLSSRTCLVPRFDGCDLLIRQRPRNVLDRTGERRAEKRTNALPVPLPVRSASELLCEIVRSERLRCHFPPLRGGRLHRFSINERTNERIGRNYLSLQRTIVWVTTHIANERTYLLTFARTFACYTICKSYEHALRNPPYIPPMCPLSFATHRRPQSYQFSAFRLSYVYRVVYHVIL